VAGAGGAHGSGGSSVDGARGRFATGFDDGPFSSLDSESSESEAGSARRRLGTAAFGFLTPGGFLGSFKFRTPPLPLRVWIGVPSAV